MKFTKMHLVLRLTTTITTTYYYGCGIINKYMVMMMVILDLL